MYTIHKIGTPKISLPNHWTEYESQYWNNDDGWVLKKDASVFESNDYYLPEDGEWVEIYVNEPVED